MTFIELVEAVSNKAMVKKGDAKNVIKSLFDTIEDSVLTNHVDVAIPHFGKFKLRSIKGGKRSIGGVERDIKARDTLKFVSYAKKALS